MESFSSYSDAELLRLLTQDNKKAFEYLFHQFYTPLCRFSLKYVRQEEATEEIVQDVFLYIWEKRNIIQIKSSLKAYLFTAVKNRSINYLKAQMDHLEDADSLPESKHPFYQENEDNLDHQELVKFVGLAVDNLPNKCKIIFNLSRNSGLTYQEISEELNISKKTVEAQMSIALKRLRESLSMHWDKIVLILALGLMLEQIFNLF